MLLSFTEENYLKVIYALSGGPGSRIANQEIAERLALNPATVTEMLRRLHQKQLIDYSRSLGARLTPEGEQLALQVVRKHRLWETFLVEKMEFSWDEVHDVAEQLEHVQSEKLLEKLDKLLGYPKFDPHGDPIPDPKGRLPIAEAIPLSECPAGKSYRLTGVRNHSSSFLKYLDRIGLHLNDLIELEEARDFDQSVQVLLPGNNRTVFSTEVAGSLLVVAC
jgi:DtxR family Mn-dependent transcriptional regulator